MPSFEDHDGDLWFATNNGISFIIARRNNGILFSAVSTPQAIVKPYLHLIVRSGARHHLAGGYSSGIYQINKKLLSTEFFTPSLFSNLNIRPDKYIRSL